MHHNHQTKNADLGNALLLDDSREPRETKSPNQDLIPPPSTHDIYIPFTQNKPLEVNRSVDPQGKIDIYLDNCITVIPDIGNNRPRGNAATTLAIHAVSQLLPQKEPVPRDKSIETSKGKSEGALEEIKVIL